jgi:fumarylacetoacetase
MIKANDKSLSSWIEVPRNSDFPIQNIPFGVFTTKANKTVVGTRIGDTAIDLNQLATLGLLDVDANVFAQDKMNDFIKLGKKTTRLVRDQISDVFSTANTKSKSDDKIKAALHPVAEITMLLPIRIGDYTDFYSSIEHATNVGTMFRDPANALLPNWKHIPVAYHGRASSIMISGQDIHRPKGQQRPKDDEPPVFGPCKLLDFELEMSFITYEGKPIGESITIGETDEFIFGMCIFNDWSARDIQKWEYVPLGPFLAKNFASSMSPWIVTLDALEPFRVAGPKQETKVLPYLEFDGDQNIDINLEASIVTPSGEEKVVTNTNYKHMYWNMGQQLAHHTCNGCDIHAGDMLASGTISGPTPDSYGSMLEISWKGTKPVAMPDGTERRFIQDGDTVVMRGHAEKDGVRVGFGEVRTLVKPTK